MQKPCLHFSLIVLTACCASVPALSQTADAFAPQVDNRVRCLALQPDGKVLVGGYFKKVSGVSRPGFARLDADGSLDLGFAPTSGADFCLAIQPDGKIVAGARAERFDPSGTLHDMSSLDIDGQVSCLALQEDGKVLVGGFIGRIGGQARTNIARLNPDWSLDASFNCWADAEVTCMAQQENGKIVIGGYFNSVDGQTRTRICRLNADGTLDDTFSASAGDAVFALAVQPDGKILVGGYFTNLNGQIRSGIGRLNPDGSLDAAFNSVIADPHVVRCLALQTDGRILVAGLFGTIPETGANLCRLNSDGSVDTNFNAQVSSSYDDVESVALQSDGKIVAVGSFAGIGGLPREFVGRLSNTDPASQSLAFDGSTITWARGGTGPEVWRTRFAVSPDHGKSWMKLGDGARIPGGWRLGGLSLALNATIRARGYTANSFVEAILGPPIILENPVNITKDAGAGTTFTVYAGGTQPLSYQWRKNGAPLADAVNVSGARKPTLILTSVFGANAGNYAVVISNSFGSVTSTVATLTIRDPVVMLQPVSVIRQIGENAAFTVGVIGTPPFTYQWRKNGKPLIGASQASLSLSNLQSTDAAVYDTVVRNAWGSVTSKVALLTINLALADSFDPEPAGQWGGSIGGLVAQPDGRILVSGSFYSIAGQNYTNLARLNPDGTLDASFNPAAFGFNGGGPLMLMPDGKIIAGGDYLLRLNADGTPDPSLALGGAGSLLLLPNGKFLAGDYLGVNGKGNVVRFNSDGKLDPTFTPGAHNAIPDGYVTMAAQPDGKLVVGGYFTRYSEVNEDFGFLVRVDAEGRPDTNFNAAVVLNLSNPEQIVHIESVAVQPDGKILVGGMFSWAGGQYRTNFARLEPDGRADASFHPNPEGIVTSIALQADGKIVVGGWFTTMGGERRTNLARLYPDGTVDPTFNPGLDPGVWYPITAVALQNDGKILVGGAFTNLAGQARMNLGRLVNNDPANQSFTFDGSVLTWMRDGSIPEVWATTFAYTTNGGVSWTELGRGARVPGGWQVTGVAAPARAAFRAHGYLTTGPGNRSSSLVESFTGPAGIYTQPASITRNAGTIADLYVHAGGAGPTLFQWHKDGRDLIDGANVSGALSDHLTLTSLLSADSGAYSAIFTYGGRTVTSSVATLTVIDPALNIQPINQVTNIGCTLVLNPSAAGTPPLYYQWWKDGTAKAGATQQSLLLTNLQLSDAGKYVLVVSNVFGIAVSTAAVVTAQAPAADAFNAHRIDDPVSCLAPEPDGRILIAGESGMFERLEADGSSSLSFAPYYSVGANVVESLSVLADGKILAAGSFSIMSGQNRNDIARFNPNGTIDTFDPNYLAGTVYALVAQSDGKLIVGGYFSTSPQNIGKSLARFNPDGSLDSSFDPGMPDSYAIVHCLLYQPDGKILVGGSFNAVAGLARTNIVRLNADGTLDASFNSGIEDPVTSVALQADGRVLVATASAGVFQTRCALQRLNSDGTLDTSFTTALGYYSAVHAMALQTDGRILIGGDFKTIDGQNWGNLARLNPDGSLDTSFSPQVSGYYSSVSSLAVQSDGRIVVGGAFSTLAGQFRNNIGRLENNVPATQSLTFDGSTITWLRGGGSPEIWRANFQYSADATSWVDLGDATRISGGWHLSGVSLPAGSILLARGFIQNGTGSWFVESSMFVGSSGRPFMLPDSSVGSAAGAFGFNIIGAPGQVVVVEASENLADWIPVNTLTLDSAPQHFSDPAAPDSHSKFYRLRLAQ